jgi:formylglycine-generating enzyme required for sulfatase activity/serine/threonine protein kinase
MTSIGASVGPDDLPEVFGRYRIKRRIARGGMGAVYLAHDTTLERDVALKVPLIDADDRAEWLARFYREARAAAALRHPNLCPVYDVGEIDGTPYLTMAYIEGHSLAHLGGRAHSPRHAATIVRQIALALAEAHHHGVLHRDLKPANIMIDQRHEPIVMDFGLARRGDADDARLTHSGKMLGTPAYMPPEQVLGDVAAMGPACDIYSLGVILYELLCGKPPFDGPTAVVLGQILGSEPIPPSHRHADVDPTLEAICLKAMAKSPERRFASMDAFAAALNDYLRMPPRSTTAKPAPLSPPSTVPGAGPPTILPQLATAVLTPTQVGTGMGQADYEPPTPTSFPPGAWWSRGQWQLLTVLACAASISLAGLLIVIARNDTAGPVDQIADRGGSANPSKDPAAGPQPAGDKPAQNDAAPPKATGALAVSTSRAVSLRPGQQVSLKVRVERQGCSGPVEIVWSGLPRSVAGDGLVIPSGESDAQLELIAADDAQPVSAKAIIFASLKNLQATADVEVIVSTLKVASAERSAPAAPPTGKPAEEEAVPAVPKAVAMGDQKSAPVPAKESLSAPSSIQLPKEVTNSLHMKLVLVPNGEFKMGSGESMVELKQSFGVLPAEFEFSNANEQPLHPVKITKPFYMGAYEVTTTQFAKFAESQGFTTDAEKQKKGGWGWDALQRQFVQQPAFSWRITGFPQTGVHPVVNVSWDDAVAFCDWLSTLEHKRYRLPTEAEWEYACRAGTTTRFYSGDKIDSLVEIANVADQTAHETLGTLFYVFARDGFAFTSPVGHFRPNAFGLYDMTGNVWEWCADWYDTGYYVSSPPDDPPGPAAGETRVARGASFNDPPVYQRSSKRDCLAPTECYCAHGFRVVCEIDMNEKP